MDIESFVADRSQYVAVGAERSETVRLASGVRQRSILGPLLFATYVSPIRQVNVTFGVQHHQLLWKANRKPSFRMVPV